MPIFARDFGRRWFWMLAAVSSWESMPAFSLMLSIMER